MIPDLHLMLRLFSFYLQIIANNFDVEMAMLIKLTDLLLESATIRIPNASSFLFYGVLMLEWTITKGRTLTNPEKLSLATKHFELYHFKAITGMVSF